MQHKKKAKLIFNRDKEDNITVDLYFGGKKYDVSIPELRVLFQLRTNEEVEPYLKRLSGQIDYLMTEGDSKEFDKTIDSILGI